MNDRQKCMKIPKKRNKIKWRSVTCSHIWHVDISKYVYLLDTHSVKVLAKLCVTKLKCRFLMYFSDIGQCWRPAQKTEYILNIVNS